MIKCKDCKNFQEIANTNETRQGLCKYPTAFEPVCADNICIFVPNPLTCADCDRFGNDFACMTALPDDSAVDCGGFIDKDETEFINILCRWQMRGIDVASKVDELIDSFAQEFGTPWEAK